MEGLKGRVPSVVSWFRFHFGSKREEPLSNNLFGIDDDDLSRTYRIQAERQALRSGRRWLRTMSVMLLPMMVAIVIADLCSFTRAGAHAMIFLSGLLSMPMMRRIETQLIRRELEHILSNVGRCTHCGYDLHQATRGRCPECGAAFDPGRS